MAAETSMMDIVIHIDETLDAAKRDALLAAVRGTDGVIAVGYHNETAHLLIVVFNPKNLSSADVLAKIQSTGVHAELTGG